MRRSLIVLVCLVLVIAGIIFIERQSGLASARLLECLLLFFLSATCAWWIRGTSRNIVLVLCSLFFGVTVLEGAALVTRPRGQAGPGGPTFNDSGLSGARPILGWGPRKPGVFHVTKTQGNGRVIYDTRVTIDENLNRLTKPSSGLRPIVFFGDSWIYGDGVNDNGTLPQNFADLNRGKIPVLNLAMAGWSPAQNLADLSMDLYEPALQSPRHFVLFTAAFHLERTACKGAYAFSPGPRYVIKGGTITYAGPCLGLGGRLLMPVIRFIRGSELYNRLLPYFDKASTRDVETYIKIIETFVETAKRDHKVETTVLFAPFENTYLNGTGYTETKIIEELRKAGIDVLVDKLPKIANDDLYWIPVDGHPSAFSNAARAREIEMHLQAVDPAALVVDDAASR